MKMKKILASLVLGIGILDVPYAEVSGISNKAYSYDIPKELSIIKDEVDIIEVNHFFNGQANLVLDQIIFWDWYEEYECFNVIDWRLMKSKSQIPIRYKEGYRAFWKDEKDEVIRETYSRWKRETWTLYDPEAYNRSILDIHQRKGLTKIKEKDIKKAIERLREEENEMVERNEQGGD
jgi:hypothetical protein